MEIWVAQFLSGDFFIFYFFLFFFSLGLWAVYEKLSLWEVFGVSIFLIIVFLKNLVLQEGILISESYKLLK